MQVEKSLNTGLLVAILFTLLAKEPQPVVMKPFEIRPAAAATVGAEEQKQPAPQAGNIVFQRPSRAALKDPVSFYDNRQNQLLMALTK